FKNWFYSLLAMSTVLENREPFKTVLGFATLFGENGKPMHKSSGNMIEFNEGARKMGVDIMRWLYLTHDPAANLNFGYGPAEKIRRRFFLILWNVYRFFGDYALIDGWKIGKRKAAGEKIPLLDRWILAKLNSLTNLVTESLERYDPLAAANALERFVVSDLSQWYVRRSRGRVGPAVKDGPDKRDFYAVMEEVMTTVIRLLAPFIPFVAEDIYRNLTGKDSVHLAKWPHAGKSDLVLEEEMEKAREIASLGHSYRKTNQINLRQPLAKVTVVGFSGFKKHAQDLVQILKEELNVKAVEFKAKGELGVSFNTALTPELKAEKSSRDLIRAVQELRKQANLKLTDKISITYPENQENKLAVALFSSLIRQETLAKGLKPGDNLEVKRIA
ncbi:MAG: class I tRNA ligase family protein, partial [Patescibacteria group bacterium]